MGLAAQLLTRVRGGASPTATFTDSTDNAMRCNGRGEGLFAQALPPKAELARLGTSWQASIPTGSAFTSVAAWPTTRAELVISNTAPAAKLAATCMIIDQVWVAEIVTETAASHLTLIAQISTAGRVALATNNAAVLVTSQSGKAAAYNGVGSFALANTAFAIASQWQVIGQSQMAGAAAVSVGQSTLAELGGLFIVPPQATLCLNAVVGTVVASSSILGLVWHEQVLDLA